MEKSVFLCIFNPETHEIVGAEVYTNMDDAQVRDTMYQTEAFARGFPWKSYRGDKPFEFEKEKKE